MGFVTDSISADNPPNAVTCSVSSVQQDGIQKKKDNVLETQKIELLLILDQKVRTARRLIGYHTGC